MCYWQFYNHLISYCIVIYNNFSATFYNCGSIIIRCMPNVKATKFEHLPLRSWLLCIWMYWNPVPCLYNLQVLLDWVYLFDSCFSRWRPWMDIFYQCDRNANNYPFSTLWLKIKWMEKKAWYLLQRLHFLDDYIPGICNKFQIETFVLYSFI